MNGITRGDGGLFENGGTRRIAAGWLLERHIGCLLNSYRRQGFDTFLCGALTIIANAPRPLVGACGHGSNVARPIVRSNKSRSKLRWMGADPSAVPQISDDSYAARRIVCVVPLTAVSTCRNVRVRNLYSESAPTRSPRRRELAMKPARSRPSTLAVLRLMTSSNLVGCANGKSAGLLPLKILFTYSAVRRQLSTKSGPNWMRPPRRANSGSPVMTAFGASARARRSALENAKEHDPLERRDRADALSHDPVGRILRYGRHHIRQHHLVHPRGLRDYDDEIDMRDAKQFWDAYDRQGV